MFVLGGVDGTGHKTIAFRAEADFVSEGVVNSCYVKGDFDLGEGLTVDLVGHPASKPQHEERD